MTIYTRRGDSGETSLADGSRVPKDSARVEALGAVDEANSAIGVARAVVTDPYLDEVLGFVQQHLFNCSSSLATPTGSVTERTPGVGDDDVAALERAIDRLEGHTGPVRRFVLEGGCDAAARLHLARAVARRADRRIVTLAHAESVDRHVMAFVNRASDVLFAAARYANLLEEVAEEEWDAQANPPA